MASYSRSIITFLLVLLFMVVIAVTVLAGEHTVVPTKSDSDVVFCLQHYWGLIIDILLVY